MLIFEALNLKSNFGIRLENILKSVLLIVNHIRNILIIFYLMLLADMSEDDQWPGILDSLTEKLRVNNVPHQVKAEMDFLLDMSCKENVFLI